MQAHYQRIDPARNMARYYAIDIQRDLFGDWTLIRRWGRIGQPGRESLTSYTRHTEAIDAAMRLSSRKLQRGYRPVFY